MIIYDEYIKFKKGTDVKLNNKICYVFGAGEYYNETIVPEDESLIIAADGGYSFLMNKGIEPDIVVGDFDSIGLIPEHKNVIKLNPIKDETDTYRAIKMGLEQGYSTFHIYGGTGGRSSHTFANIQTLLMLSKNNAQGFLYGNNEVMTVISNNRINFSTDSEGYVSIFSLSTNCFGVDESGLKYLLDDYTLTNDYPIGVSNEFVGKESCIAVKNGSLLIIFSNKAKIIDKYK